MGTSSTLLGSFLEFDDNQAITSHSASDEEIITQVIKLRTNEKNTADDDEDDDIQPPPPPTSDEAMAALSIVRRYIETLENTQSESKMLCAVSRRMIREKMTEIGKLKQTSIKMFTRDVN